MIHLQREDQPSPLKHRKSPYFCFTALLWPHVCVYISAARILHPCARGGRPWWGWGGWVGGAYSTAGPTDLFTDRGPERRTQEKVKQTQPRPFSQDTSRHSYWLTHWAALLFSLVPPPPPNPHAAPLFKGDLEVWPLNFDPIGKAEAVPKGPGSRRGSSVECLDSGCCPGAAGVTACRPLLAATRSLQSSWSGALKALMTHLG